MKIMEIVRTGDLERIKYERTEDVVVAQVFTKIYGVGK
jgi:DNA polymerase lambda